MFILLTHPPTHTYMYLQSELHSFQRVATYLTLSGENNVVACWEKSIIVIKYFDNNQLISTYQHCFTSNLLDRWMEGGFRLKLPQMKDMECV